MAATVIWEDVDRPTQEVYFETEEVFADDLSCNPDAFLLACTIPALHYGEERIFVDGEICPELRNGLSIAMSWLQHWYYKPSRKPIQIEAKIRAGIRNWHKPKRAGIFFSGGLDSFAMLRANRLNFPSEHPWSIRDGLLVYGLEMDKLEAFEYVKASLSEAAQEIGITLIPVYTNLYLHYRDEDAKDSFRFWVYEYQGAALAAVAHAFTRRFSVISVASTLWTGDLQPEGSEGYLQRWGSHPLLDPNYSSVDLRIRHDSTTLSKLAKTQLIADWDVALKHLRVCNQYKLYRPGKLNCGQCEKCVRRMLTLQALGVLNQTDAFPTQEVSEELLRSKISVNNLNLHFYKELVVYLTEKSHYGLAHAVESKIAEYHRLQRKKFIRERIKQFDQRYLNGNLLRIKRWIL